jgi:hypothetical protein
MLTNYWQDLLSLWNLEFFWFSNMFFLYFLPDGLSYEMSLWGDKEIEGGDLWMFWGWGIDFVDFKFNTLLFSFSN